MDSFISSSIEKSGQSTAPTLAARSSVSHDVTDEIPVPDYMAEVGRIVSFSASALDENRYLDGSSVEATGLLACTVTYVGDDSSLNAYPVNCDFSVRIPLSAEAGELAADRVAVRTEVASFSFRATGPRKLALSAKLCTSVFGVGETRISPLTVAESQGGERKPTAEEDASIEYKKTRTAFSSACFMHMTGETSGELTVPGGAGEDGAGPKMVSCSGVSSVTGVTPSRDGLTVKGETFVTCLCLTESGEYVTVGASAPFEDKLVAPRPAADGAAIDGAAFVRCASVNVNDAGGGVFVFSSEHDVDGELWSTEETDIATDAYGTEYRCDAERSDKETLFFSGAVASSFSASGSGRAPAGGDHCVIAASGRIVGGSAEVAADGRFVFTGTCAVTAVLAGDGKAEPAETSFPVRFETRLKNGVPEESEPVVRWEAAVTSASAKQDGDRLTAAAEIAVSASVAAKKRVPLVSRVRLTTDEPVPRDRSSVRIRFPEEGQTVWDVRRDLCAGPENVTVVGAEGDGPLPRGSAVIVYER